VVVGLNKRQILVISTVSTVIGVFSIVALILRIRFVNSFIAVESNLELNKVEQ